MPDEQPSSGMLKVSGKRLTGKIVILLDRQTQSYADRIPELGTPYSVEAGRPVDGLYFFDADLRPGSGNLDELILNYKWYYSGAYDTELRTGLVDTPLIGHPNYLLRWDNYLVSTDTTKTDVPAWWADAKSIDDIKDEEDYKAGTYKIVTTVNASQGVVVDSRIKKKNTYKKPTVIVTEKVWFDREELAVNLSQGIGFLSAPANTYGRSTDDDKWMITSSPVKRDGGYWLTTRTFEYNDDKQTLSDSGVVESWDTDIYTI